MSLVNVWLNFQKLISQICQYFCRKNVRSFCNAKASLTFSTKNFSVFGYKVVRHLTSWPLKELVKLTMLWTTGPWSGEDFMTILGIIFLISPAKRDSWSNEQSKHLSLCTIKENNLLFNFGNSCFYCENTKFYRFLRRTESHMRFCSAKPVPGIGVWNITYVRNRFDQHNLCQE